MANPTRITDFSTTAANNVPSGTENVGTNADDLVRAIQATIRLDLASKGADIASAATTDLGAVGGLMHDITGTTTITALGTIASGVWKVLQFDGALTLTHNASSLILPGGANITTAAGDVAIFMSLGSGNWICLSYTRVTGGIVRSTSAQLAAAITDETGSGALVFGTSPTLVTPALVTPALGTPASGVLTNCTGLPQAGFKTTTGEVSSSNADLTLPGGTYGFYPQVRVSNSAFTYAASIANAAANTSYVTNIYVNSSSAVTYAQQRYVQASPPYNLGNGDVPLFTFVWVDSLGNIKATYVAPEPPWAYNGPTDIRADYYKNGKGYQKPRLTPQQRLDLRGDKRDAVISQIAKAGDLEITHAIKNADMGLIPHPFLSNDLTGSSIVLLDPVGEMCERLALLHSSGESISELLHGSHLVLDNTPLSAATPKGVVARKAKWK